MADLRVLQVLGDTDDVDDARFALDLHHALSGRSIEVRTIALGPGRVGGLEGLVPVMSPSRRSIAAHTQLRREQRWADVVILRGHGPATVAGLAGTGGGPPSVLTLGEEARRWTGDPVPSRVRRLVDRGTRLVVTHDSARSVAVALGREPSDPAVVPYGVPTRSAPTTSAQRRAARDVLGLTGAAVVARFVGSPGVDDGDVVARRAARRAGVVLVDYRSGDAEIVAAAAVVALLPTRRTAGPPRGLLLAGRDGSALVAPSDGALVDLVDDSTGVVTAPDEPSVTATLELLAADTDLVAARAAGASERVRAKYDLDGVATRWAELLVDVAAAPGT